MFAENSLKLNSNLNQMVALFLSEAMRGHRLTLSRAAEISERVTSKLGRLASEEDALKMLTDIEKDFAEVSALKQALHFGYKSSDVKTYEVDIREYASKFFTKDIRQSNEFLQDATRQNATIQNLCLKYPQFCHFLLSRHQIQPA